MENDKPALQKIALFLRHPSQSFFSTRLLWQSCDQMWLMAGDTATDFNYYSKRTILAAVYSSTLLYFLKDDSKEHQKTQSFLKKRIDDVMKIEGIKAKIKNLL